MWVNKVPNVHVWADHTSVKLLLGILTAALSRAGPPIWQNGTEICEEKLVKHDHFCLLVKSWTDVTVQTESDPAVKWSKKRAFHSWNSAFVDHRTGSVAETPAASPHCSSTVTIFSPEFRLRPVQRPCLPPALLPLCQTGAVPPGEAAEAISTSNLTSVWSRHRNPLALKKLPPSLCLTSNGAFFSSLSFFMFVCKVLYITWIYYAHILPNG